jgi:hypothetical protein
MIVILLSSVVTNLEEIVLPFSEGQGERKGREEETTGWRTTSPTYKTV